jgi:alpha-tubulin suppressor-like RCC1 family protein
LNGKTILSIATGYNHACAIASDNQAYCWGRNSQGQIGDNNVTGRYVPTAVDTSGVLTGKTILSISAGGNHTCAIASDNQVYCWGYDHYGQLGDNTTTDSLVPVAVNTSGVLAGKTILSVSAGVNHTCVIASDNQAYCWGWNNYGQLGDNTSGTNRLVPAAVDMSGFPPTPQVTLGGLPCTDITMISDTELTCVTPAHAAGLVDVVITLANGNVLTIANGFTYLDKPLPPLPPSPPLPPDSGFWF